jgi:hypothetical protein
MRNQGKIKLGFYPLPVAEAVRLKNFLVLPGAILSLGFSLQSGFTVDEVRRHGKI